MPLTPFHLGPSFLFGMVFQRQINMASILIASTAIDIRTILCFFFFKCQLHGPLHTYLGATMFAGAIIVVIFVSRNKLHKISNKLKIHQSYTLKSIVLGSLIGAWSHVLLDSFMHFDVTPFWPMLGNTFFQQISNEANYAITILSFLGGATIYFYKIYKQRTLTFH